MANDRTGGRGMKRERREMDLERKRDEARRQKEAEMLPDFCSLRSFRKSLLFTVTMIMILDHGTEKWNERERKRERKKEMKRKEENGK